MLANGRGEAGARFADFAEAIRSEGAPVPDGIRPPDLDPDFIPDPGERVEVGGHDLMFAVTGMSAEDQNRASQAYYEALQQVVKTTQRNFALLVTAVWLGSTAALYAFGWAIAWIRRGFRPS
jgi:hypothetical protein